MIYWVPSPKFTAGRAGVAVVALVHHRMVGTLKSTDTTFTTGTRIASTTFGVGYGCGKAGHPATAAHVHQYVNLDDQAWGNGNWDATGAWDDSYPTSLINARTISIEHHDNGGSADPAVKGVVPEKVIVESIRLDQLLLGGDVAAWRAAGIRWRSDGDASRIAKELRALVPGKRTIVDHNFVSGRLKPYCWRPWEGDKVGFPQARYIASLTAEPEGEADMGPVIAQYVPGHVAVIRATSNVRSEPKVSSTNLLRVVPSGATESWVATGWVKGGTTGSGKDLWLTRWNAGRWEYTADVNVTSISAPVTDCSSAVAEAVRPLEDALQVANRKIGAAKLALG
jgi:hypothetical protein